MTEENRNTDEYFQNVLAEHGLPQETTKGQYMLYATKRATRRLLLWVLALPAVIAAFFLLLPLVLEDTDTAASLALDESQEPRAWMFLIGSLVGMYVVHIATRSWARGGTTARPSEAENQNGN